METASMNARIAALYATVVAGEHDPLDTLESDAAAELFVDSYAAEGVAARMMDELTELIGDERRAAFSLGYQTAIRVLMGTAE